MSLSLAGGGGRQKRSTELLEDTTLVCSVFGVLVDKERFVVVAPATSTIFLGPDSVWILRFM
jgi:hypothetical protein